MSIFLGLAPKMPPYESMEVRSISTMQNPSEWLREQREKWERENPPFVYTDGMFGLMKIRTARPRYQVPEKEFRDYCDLYMNDYVRKAEIRNRRIDIIRRSRRRDFTNGATL